MMKNDSSIKRKLYCNKCNWECTLPINFDIKLINKICLECDSEAIIKNINKEANLSEFDFLSKIVDIDNKRETLDLIKNPNILKLDEKPISGFVNRWSPLIFIPRIIYEMMEKGRELNAKDVLEEFITKSLDYREFLKKIEKENNIPRGFRLSDGFPTEEKKSIKRFSRTYLGADPSKELFSERAGLSQEMGFITLNYSIENEQELVKLGLTEVGFEALKINLHYTTSLEVTIHKPVGASEVKLPKWFDKNDISRIFQILQSRSKSEYAWIQFLLKQMAASVRGLTVADIVNKEIEREMTEGQTNRWFERGSNTPLISKMEDDDMDREDIEEILEKKILSTITGTLGRMKELSLIFNFKRARQTFYKATPQGKDWAKKWDSEDR